MNIFGFITIGLVFVSVLLIYYVEIPRLRREVKNQGWYLEHTEKTISRLISDVDMIKSARGTFSRQLENLTSEVDSNITSIRQNSESTNRRVEQLYRLFQGLENTARHHSNILQVYLDSHKPKESKKKKSGK
jgi:predicted RNase H-like nuclease (RuvC/YqgF family)